MRWAPSNAFLVWYAWSLTSIVPHTTSGAARHFPYTMLRNYTIIFLLLSFLSVRSLCTQLNRREEQGEGSDVDDDMTIVDSD